MKKLLILAMAAACVCAAANAGKPADDPKKQRIAELRKVLGDTRTTFDIWNAGFIARHEKMLSEAECDRMQRDYLAALVELRGLSPSDGALALEAAKAFLYAERADEARPHAEAAEKLIKGGYELDCAAFCTANCLWAAGEKEAAMAKLEEILKRKNNTPRRQMSVSTIANMALHYWRGDTLDTMKLPHSADMRAFPEPKEAQYSDATARLPEKVRVKLSGLDADDERVKLLTAKLARAGVTAEVAGFLSFFSSAAYEISVEVTDEAEVAQAEGYALEIAEKATRIRARDRQGALWGIVSFLQCMDAAGRRVRVCKIRDWPTTARRGALADYTWPGYVEYALFTKSNSFAPDPFCCYDRFYPLCEYVDGEVARQARAFGIELFAYVTWLTMYPQPPISDPRTLDYQVKVLKRFAKMGMGVYFPFDDSRYPLHPKDKEKFGIGANCDAKHVTAVYRAVKAEYPDFKMVFCPPFYWGPDSKASYPEDRENYLRSLGEFLDPEILVYWTGPQVKGYDKKPYQVKWFTDLTKHKPTIFQNGTGPHNLLNYVADEIEWTKWHYPEFYTSIDAYHLNIHLGGNTVHAGTLADALWNPEGYDAKRSVRRSMELFLGDGVYELLAPGVKDLAYFDKYRYGDLTPDIMGEDVGELQRKYENASNCWAKAVAKCPALKGHGSYGRGLGWAAGVVRQAKNPPDMLKKFRPHLGAVTEQAKKDLGYDPAKGDILVPPTTLMGAELQYFDARYLGKDWRLVKILRGAYTNRSAVEFNFECDPFPPTGDYELWLSAMDDELPQAVRLRISVNGKSVYEGERDFPANTGYAVRKYVIPFASMARHNRVRIEVMTPGANPNGTPWFILNYAMLRKSR